MIFENILEAIDMKSQMVQIIGTETRITYVGIDVSQKGHWLTFSSNTPKLVSIKFALVISPSFSKYSKNIEIPIFPYHE